jgi:hypothetical protein
MGVSKMNQKFVRSYFKKEVHAHRLECQLGSKFLQKLGISDIFDFQRLKDLIPGHLLFAEFDEQKVIARLRGSGLSAQRTIQIIQKLHDHDDDLYVQCAVLHKSAGLTNLRRLLVPLPENQLLLNALQEWAAGWPTAPAPQGKEK